MNINVHINYPDNIEILEKKAEDLVSLIIIEKFSTKEIKKLIGKLQDNSEHIRL